MTETTDFLEIDGALGEGGGQVLRTSVTLSMLTGKPVFIRNIRMKRSKHGLLPQHLKSVDAAAKVSQAMVEGAALGSTSLTFRPAEIQSGRYKFDIGTAGATSLVFQTIFLPLSRATATSSVIITGGTHVQWSPCYHYLEIQWLPYLRKMGFDVTSALVIAGYYPKGGGRIDTIIRPAQNISPMTLTSRGRLVRISGISAVSNLSRDIAERQKRQALGRLLNACQLRQPEIHIKIDEFPSPNKGTVLLLFAEFENSSACYYGLGELGKPAERVADEAVDALLEFFDTGAAVDQYLADQLLLPLSFANGASQFSTSQITQHLLTNAEIIRRFLPIDISIEGKLGEVGLISINPHQAGNAASP